VGGSDLKSVAFGVKKICAESSHFKSTGNFYPANGKLKIRFYMDFKKRKPTFIGKE
jgi:hypothetical protein